MISDPVERMETRIESNIEAAGLDGKCSNCGKVVGWDNLHQVYNSPDSPAGCWECCVNEWGSDPNVKES